MDNNRFRWILDQVPDWWKERTDVQIDVDTTTALVPGCLPITPGDWIIKDGDHIRTEPNPDGRVEAENYLRDLKSQSSQADEQQPSAAKLLIDDANTHPVNEFWVFLTHDANGNEGICGMTVPGGGWMSMVAASAESAEHLKDIARQIARHGRHSVQMVRFTRAETVETFGQPKPDAGTAPRAVLIMPRPTSVSASEPAPSPEPDSDSGVNEITSFEQVPTEPKPS